MIFTIQVELACESNTIQEAFAQVPDKGLFYILPLNFKNKSCYIIAYGVFKNKAQAEESYKKLPAIFVKQPYPPKIVSAATLLK